MRDEKRRRWSSWLPVGQQRSNRQWHATGLEAKVLRLERLEDRRLLAITVNTLVDEFDGSIVDGDISLRDAVAAAQDGETINFSVAGTIELTLGNLAINKNLTIAGPGAAQLTLDAGGASRAVSVAQGVTSTISGMTITGASSSAIYVNGDLTLRDSVVTGNSGGNGAGIWVGSNLEATLNVEDSVISGNVANAGDGGGIYGFNALVTLTRSTIEGNSANRGGGVYNVTGLTVIVNSTISGNSATQGAGINVGFADVFQSTISGNTHGAGIFAAFETYVVQSTVTDNTIGIVSVSSAVTLQNTIVAHNVQQLDIQGSVNAATSRNNLIGAREFDGYAGGLLDGINGNIVGVRFHTLGPLADNGGPTKTHLIPSYSPAVDAGDNSLVPIDPATGQPFTVDQLGNSRPFAGGTVDIGAVEGQGTVVPSTFVNTTIDEDDFNATTSLREAVAFAVYLGSPTVTFDPALFLDGPRTVSMTLGTITIDASQGPLSILGPGADLLTIDGNHHTSQFVVLGEFPATISNLTFHRGVRAIENFGDLTISGSVISNSTQHGVENRHKLTIERSLIVGNSSTLGGAGIRNFGGQLIVRNSTIAENMSQAGGAGIYSSDFGAKLASLQVAHSTIVDNISSSGPAGIYWLHGDFTLSHSIVARNINVNSGPSDLVDSGFGSIVGDYNLIGDALTAATLSNNINGNMVGVDPLLGSLANNGGPTRTLALLPGSPAINAGDLAFDPQAFVPPLAYDQRGSGFARVVAGRVDVGAFEAFRHGYY
ncbi:MAG TPA: right-handed parallel beta-helix repeat-containing protein, partial [Lacipirellulaceae bacterium]|nr:right-handed parallel beta-helix repeat-containing protein [Lacipirellulaceae bacterium]